MVESWQTRFSAWMKHLSRRTIVVVGGVIVILMLALGFLGPLIHSADPQAMNVFHRLSSPGSNFLFGTDEFGRDVLTRVIHGVRLSLIVGITVTAFSTVAGTVVGVVAGYFPKLDNVLMRLMDGLMAFPSVILAIALMATLGPSARNVIIALGITYTPRMARIVRGAVLVIREQEFVQAARAIGAGSPRILALHLLPNCLSPMIIQGTFIFAYAVLGEALLSFLGVGVPPQVPSLGTMMSAGRTYIQLAPWITVIPGVFVVLTVLGLNLIGDGLRDALDPKLRRLG